jgi:hypothetical protein
MKTYPRDEKHFPDWVKHNIVEVNRWLEYMGIKTLRGKVIYIYGVMRGIQ